MEASSSTSPQDYDAGSNDPNDSIVSKSGRVKYTRKRTGCLTCRGRKKRCSEERPICAVCQRLKLQCVWPDPEDLKRKVSRKRKNSRIPTDEEEMQPQYAAGGAHYNIGSSSMNGTYELPPAPLMSQPGASPYMPINQLHPSTQTAPLAIPPHPIQTSPIDPSLAGLTVPGQLNDGQQPINSYPSPSALSMSMSPSSHGSNTHTAWDSLLKGVDAVSYAHQHQNVSPTGTMQPELPLPQPVTTRSNPPQPAQRWPAPPPPAPPAPDGHLTPMSSNFFSTILKFPQQHAIADKNNKRDSDSTRSEGLSLEDLLAWHNTSPGDSPRLFEIPNFHPDDTKSGFAPPLFDFARSPSPPSAFMNSLSRPLSPAFISSVGSFLNQAISPAPNSQAETSLVNNADSEHTQSFLLNHYTQGLARLVSVAADSANLFLILLPFARQHSFLMLSILGWSAANLCAAGPANIALGEIADRYTSQAVEQLDRAITEGQADWQVILGTILMLVQVAICRGDVGSWKSRLKQAAGIIQQHAALCHSGLGRMLVKNFIYHDILSSSSAREGSMLDYNAFASSVASAPQAAQDELNARKEKDEIEIDVLMGVAEPVFLLIGRISNLLIKKRQLSRQYGRLEDTELLEFHAEADEIKLALEKERLGLESLLLRRPDLEPHRAFHEAYRLAAELYLNMTLSMPALSMPMLYLTRRLLATVEKIDAQSLPGHCSMHWTIYIMQLNATPLRSSSSLLTDQERAHRCNESFYSKFHFLNVPRSRTVVKAVWERNDGGRVFVEPHDILTEWGWELNWA